MNQVEICCGSYQDGIAAYQGGAKRIELNSALSVGGLTPSVVALRRLKKETDLKVMCMVRPRAGGFCYDETDTAIMMEEAELLLENGADGIVFGFLKEDKTIDEKKTQDMVKLIKSYQKEAVFHRAIDVTMNIDEAVQCLIHCGVDRILTSGQRAKAMEGIECIAHMQKAYGDRIQILPGSGMNAQNAQEMLEKTQVHQIHSSCKSFAHDPTTVSQYVTYAYMQAPHESDYDQVDATLVKQLVDVVMR